MINAQQAQVIKRCQSSVTWFLRNFGKLRHPSAGILPFNPFSYQCKAIKSFRQNRLNIFRKCRQSGASKIAGSFATWFAMFHSHKTILIVSRKNDDAMSFLRDHIVFLYEHLPQWMQDVWEPLKLNEHEIVFPNGSRIQSLTSHPDVLRSHASSLNIIDESAFIQGMDVMWAGGWPCQVGDTLIQTDGGLCRIDSFDINGGEWQDLDINVATDDGYKHCDKLHIPRNMEPAPTIIIKTKLGFVNEGTHHHRLRTIDEGGNYVWKQLCKFRKGDLIISKPGQFVGKRRKLSNGFELDTKLAELIGLYIGDGTLYTSRPKRFKIHFDPQDYVTKDYAIQRLNEILVSFNNPTLAYSENGNCTINLRLNSSPFVGLLCDNNLNSKTCPQDAEIPELILGSDRQVICAFLRGLFDSDGWCYQSSTCLKLGFSTQSERLATQVQIALHSLGIISKISRPKNGRGRWGTERAWKLSILDGHSKELFKEIGFITARKQVNLDNHHSTNIASFIEHPVLIDEFLNDVHEKILDLSKTDTRKKLLACYYGWRKKGRINYSTIEELTELFNLSNRLSKLISDNLYFDVVKSTANGLAPVYDISVPDNNTYLANGIISHNTLQHGGNVIVISTTNGIGNWYWSTCTDAEAGLNTFAPLVINWWDMDWAIEYVDPLSKQHKRIAPRDGIRRCTTKEDLNRYGPYWSPWLEEQWRALQEQGEGWKFDQEILASFIGSGNTVLTKTVISFVQSTVRDPIQKVSGFQTYVHPVTGEAEELDFDFVDPNEGLWIWKKPVLATADKKRGDKTLEQGVRAHAYSMGIDIATGKGRDFSTIEVFDVDIMEQVAEFMARCLPRDLIKYIDRIGRWYNCALAVIERNNGGDTLIDSMRIDVMYPRVWRKKSINDTPRAPGATARARALKVQPYGFSTTIASKPTLNKYLIDFIRDKENDGYTIYSKRLLKQIQTYVRKRDKAGRDTNKTEAEDGAANFDDLVIAAGLGLLGTTDALSTDESGLVPFGGNNDFAQQEGPAVVTDGQMVAAQQAFMDKGGPMLTMPMTLSPEEMPELSAQREIENYMMQLGGIPVGQGGPIVTSQKYFYTTGKQ